MNEHKCEQTDFIHQNSLTLGKIEQSVDTLWKRTDEHKIAIDKNFKDINNLTNANVKSNSEIEHLIEKIDGLISAQRWFTFLVFGQLVYALLSQIGIGK